MIDKSFVSTGDLSRKRRKNHSVPSHRTEATKNRCETKAARTPNGRTALSGLKRKPNVGLSAAPLPAIIHRPDASPVPALSSASLPVSWS